jgi:hypothetical protein
VLCTAAESRFFLLTGRRDFATGRALRFGFSVRLLWVPDFAVRDFAVADFAARVLRRFDRLRAPMARRPTLSRNSFSNG